MIFLSYLAAAALGPAVGEIYTSAAASPWPGWQLAAETGGVRDDTSSAVFHRGNTYAIARVILVSREGVQPAIFRIEQVRFEELRSGEEAYSGIDCALLGHDPSVVFYAPATRTARGAFVWPDRIVMQRWLVDPPEICQDAGD